MEDILRAMLTVRLYGMVRSRLNPCFNGRYSQRKYNYIFISRVYVLILVLMEDTFRAKSNNPLLAGSFVLILVLMEDTFREQNLRILEFRGFDNSKTYKIGFC